jgi:DNA-binding MarR family transcriptional regulator
MGPHGVSENETRRILDAIRRILHGLRESSRAAEASLGVTGAQLFVLSSIDGRGGTPLGELATRTATHQSSVSEVAARLVDRGLVVRRTDANDRRRVVLSLTPAGRALMRRAPDAAQERLLGAAAGLPASMRAAVARGLEHVARAMEAGAHAPPMFFEEPHRRRAAGRRVTRGRRA